MAQKLKEKTRSAIIDAALEVFAKKGFRDASMSDVAGIADVSTGNIYRYFIDKQALYDAAVPAETLDMMLGALDRKIEAFHGQPILSLSETQKRFRDELISILAANPLYWVIVLRQSGGDMLVERLVKLFTGWLRSLPLPAAVAEKILSEDRLALIRLYYKNIVRLMSDHVLDFAKREDLASLLGDVLDYHLAGLDALLRSWGCFA